MIDVPEEFTISFKLDRPLRRTIRSSLPDGVEVSGELGEDSILVKHVQAKDSEEARDKALPLANAVLDEFCFKFGVATAILPTPWWAEDPDGKRFLSTADEAIGLEDEYELEKRSADGKLVEKRSSSDPVEIEVEIRVGARDYLRFFRKGCWSEEARDWFDAFRNYYLAIEWITAAHTTSGGEKSRLVATLKQCFQDQKAIDRLRQQATSCEGFIEGTGDLYADVAEFLYHANRCQLNHAKAGDIYKVPFDPAHEAEVKAAVPLARYVARELIEWYLYKRVT